MIKNDRDKNITNPPDKNSGARSDQLRRHFDEIVTETHAALLVERTLPRLVPPAVLGGLFISASWFDIWAHIPHQARPYVLAGYAIATLASPLLVRGKSVFVREKDALRHLDQQAGQGRAHPASALRSRAPDGAPPDSLRLWDRQQDKLLQEWVPQFRAHKPEPDLSRQWLYALAASALVACGAGLAAGDQRLPRLMAAFDFKAPPAIIPPPDVKAWISPPKGFKGLNAQYLEEGRALESVHKSSILYVSVIGSHPKVTLNGHILEPLPAAAGESKQATTQYKPVELAEGRNEIIVEGGPRWNVIVTPDNAPIAAIRGGVADSESGSLVLKCDKGDDFGITGGRVILSLPGAATDQSNVLPSARLPGLSLPGQTFCETVSPDAP